MSSASAAIPQPGRTKAFLRLVMIEHSVFALPFAYIAALTAMFQMDKNIHWGRLLLVTICMVGLRTFAMAVNRIIDREIDARNPRTAHRELVTGAMSVKHAWTGALIAVVIFLGSAALLNPLCLALSPLALAWVLGYSLSKRFTWWPHLWLGLGLAIAPVGGYLAVVGRWSEPPWTLIAIAVAVATWVAGFDIFYALPDEGFDRAEGLRSAVVRLGERRAILLAKLLHGVTVPALALFGWGAGFGLWYYLGVLAAAAILAYEHRLVRPGDLSRLDAAFFTMNGVMSLTVFAFALVDRLG